MKDNNKDMSLFIGISGFLKINYIDSGVSIVDTWNYVSKGKELINYIMREGVEKPSVFEDNKLGVEKLKEFNPKSEYLKYRKHLKIGIKEYIKNELGISPISDEDLDNVMNRFLELFSKEYSLNSNGFSLFPKRIKEV